MPDPDAIELGTDITGFMRKEIPESARRKALRSLWKSNPVLAVLDGLNDYDEDLHQRGFHGRPDSKDPIQGGTRPRSTKPEKPRTSVEKTSLEDAGALSTDESDSTITQEPGT